ncbi:hypothetical protein HDV04_001200 [Boothiomyces sp. JEL0838]|nr:hypothetical protein HDV04_001200 [Boothiomyces sp. JEL0838]
MSEKYYNYVQLVILIAGVALTGGEVFGPTTDTGRMTNLKKIGVMNENDINDLPNETTSLIAGIDNQPGNIRQLDILPLRCSKVRFSHEIALIIHFDQNNKPWNVERKQDL